MTNTAGFSGRLVLVKKGDAASPEVFTTIAALKDTTITLTNAAVDITSKDDSGARTLLSGTTVKSMTISGSGVLSDTAVIAALRTACDAGTHGNFQVDVVNSGAATGGGQYAGAFRVVSFVDSGNYAGEAQYSLTLESTGALTLS